MGEKGGVKKFREVVEGGKFGINGMHSIYILFSQPLHPFLLIRLAPATESEKINYGVGRMIIPFSHLKLPNPSFLLDICLFWQIAVVVEIQRHPPHKRSEDILQPMMWDSSDISSVAKLRCSGVAGISTMSMYKLEFIKMWMHFFTL